MNDWRAVAVISLLGLLLAGYMVRSNHARYVADLLGACAAIYSHHPQLGVLACALICVVRHSRWIAGALVVGLPEWLARVLLPGGYDMSSVDAGHSADVDSPEPPISSLDQPVEKGEIPQPVAENSAEIFHSGEIAATARLVEAGIAKLTEGVKIGLLAKSGDKYSRATRELQAEIKKLLDQYPNRTEQQEQLRQSLKM